MEERRRDDRLGETVATARVRRPAAALGGGTLLCLDRSQPKDEQGLREVMCEWRSVRVRCHESPHGEAVSSHLRLFHTVSSRTRVNRDERKDSGFYTRAGPNRREHVPSELNYSPRLPPLLRVSRPFCRPL